MVKKIVKAVPVSIPRQRLSPIPEEESEVDETPAPQTVIPPPAEPPVAAPPPPPVKQKRTMTAAKIESLKRANEARARLRIQAKEARTRLHIERQIEERRRHEEELEAQLEQKMLGIMQKHIGTTFARQTAHSESDREPPKRKVRIKQPEPVQESSDEDEPQAPPPPPLKRRRHDSHQAHRYYDMIFRR